MGIRKKRSRHYWVFSSYSLVLHLAGILALIILLGPPMPEPDSSPIPVRLVTSTPDRAKDHPTLHVSKMPSTKSVSLPVPEAEPSTKADPAHFHIVPPVQASIRTSTHTTVPGLYPFIQLAKNTLITPGFSDTTLRIPHFTNPTQSLVRVLVDHKAGGAHTRSTLPKVLYNPDPQYPKIARELGLEGKTLLRVEILDDGRLGSVKIRKSCGHAVLDEAATKAVQQWKFAPAQDGQFTVRSIVDLPIRFSLKSLG